MKIEAILCALERFAPLPLQDSYDNAGLQIGLTEAEVTGALLCLDVTEAVVDEAIANGFNLIISHHPLMFKGIKSLTGKDDIERCIIKSIRNNITIYSVHTNLDNALNGVSFKMAEKLGLKNTRFLDVRNGSNQDLNSATAESGAGVIGELEMSECATCFLERLKRTFSAGCVRHNGNNLEVKKVALCGGSGAFLIQKAEDSGVDAYVTADIKYHDFFGHDNILLADIGHYESEQFTTEIFYNIIKEQFPTVEVKRTYVDTNPIKYL